MKDLPKLALIGAVLLIVMAAFAFVGGWFSPTRLTQTKFVAALQGNGGVHPGFRLNHAKGLCFSGVFDSNGEAASLSRASLFGPGAKTPVIGRFALAGGMAFQADKPTTVRSMALRFAPADGTEWRTGMNNIPVFVVNSVQGFYDQLLASTPDPATRKPDPKAMEAFANSHPEFTKAIGLIKAHPPSAGFADAAYNSLDAFRLVDAAGKRAAVRWSMVPLQPAVEQATSPDDDRPSTPPANQLFDDLATQVHEHPLSWQLVFTIANPEDSTIDPTVPWPDDRRHVAAGILTIDHVSSEDGGACNDINYDPLVLPPGIEPSDDPLLSARSAVYARSHRMRAAEQGAKPPSAISPEELQKALQP